MQFPKLYSWLAALVLSGLIAGGGSGVFASPTAPGIKPGVETTQNGLTITWTAPELEILTDQEGLVWFRMSGFNELEQSGVPYLPVTSELIALPPGADPQIHIETIQERTAPLPGSLALAPAPEGVIRSKDGEIIGGGLNPRTPRSPLLTIR